MSAEVRGTLAACPLSGGTLSRMDELESIIGAAGGQLWTWAVLPVVVVLGLYFTFRSGVVQFRLIPEMFRTLTNKTPTDGAGRAQSVSAFQAFTISAASRVGVGNIAGVGTAIVVGGPGAVFWMWTMAFIGGASSFVESTLGQLYKTKDQDGFRGGPAYYMQRGLNARWAGILFAIVLIVCFPFAFSSLQANTITAAVTSTTGSEVAWLPWVIGIVLALLTALVIFGGVRRIASVTQSLVPAMAIIYLILGLIIVGMNFGEIPRVFGEIYAGAFGFQQIAGGAIGTIILTGVQRGMFSNEAGLGSAPNAGASAAVTHPVKQGLVQTLGVYFDTFLVCSITAFIILVTSPDLAGLERGIGPTQDALVESLGSWAAVALTIVIFLLAFSSILGNYYYGYSNIEFITGNRAVLTGYRLLAVLAVLGGSVASTSLVWTTADGIMGVMALINLIAIALLSGIAFKLLRNYSEQRKAGKDPVFTQDQVPGLKNVEFWQDADTVTGPIAVPKVKARK
jgi:AGCS family alanine or glycine:cation symporter